jgi:predicted amidohydrolase
MGARAPGGGGARVIVAGLQVSIAWEDPSANFARLRPWIARAAAAGARLTALPEMYSTGFSMKVDRIAEAPDGPSTTFLVEQAREHHMWIAGSVPVRFEAGQRPSNTLVLAGPLGELVRYRKIHPFTFAKEHEHYAAGGEHVVVELEGVRLALFVCYDLRFADEFWALAERTDAYLVVANWPERRRHHWQTLLQARAIENQAYVIGVNRVGEGNGLVYTGDSRIYDPWGEQLSGASSDESLLLADVDPARVRTARETFPFLRDRR